MLSSSKCCFLQVLLPEHMSYTSYSPCLNSNNYSFKPMKSNTVISDSMWHLLVFYLTWIVYEKFCGNFPSHFKFLHMYVIYPRKNSSSNLKQQLRTTWNLSISLFIIMTQFWYIHTMLEPIVAIIRYTKLLQSPFLLFTLYPYTGQCLHIGGVLYRWCCLCNAQMLWNVFNIKY